MTVDEPKIIGCDDIRAADRVKEILGTGGLVVFGTESSYGIAARMDSPAALNRLSKLKKRAPLQPLGLVATDLERVATFCRFPGSLRVLADRYWPGPLTLALTPKGALHPSLLNESKAVGVRVSTHEATRFVSEWGGGMVTATSANLRGESPANRIGELSGGVIDGVDLILDSGPCPGGPPSSVVGWAEGRLVVFREGAIGNEEMKAILENG